MLKSGSIYDIKYLLQFEIKPAVNLFIVLSISLLKFFIGFRKLLKNTFFQKEDQFLDLVVDMVENRSGLLNNSCIGRA